MTITVSEYSQAIDLVGLVPSGDVTRPDLVITLDNVPSSMLDGGATSCLNGGGDIRAASPDGTGQIPVDVRRCVVSASAPARSLEIRISPASYTSAARGITLFWGKAGATQPAADSEFGSEAVYDDAIKLPLVEAANAVAGGYEDVTGNFSATGQGAGIIDNSEVTPWGSKCTELDGIASNRVLANVDDILTKTSLTMTTWVKLPVLASDYAVVSYRDASVVGSDNSVTVWMDVGGPGKGFVGYTKTGGSATYLGSVANANALVDTWQRVTLHIDNTNTGALYVDGVVQPGSTTTQAMFTGTSISDITLGSWDYNRPMDGYLGEFNAKYDQSFDVNREEIEYLSQFDPGSFWTTSAAYDPNASGGPTTAFNSTVHTHTSDQIVLTQSNTVAINSSSHDHVTESMAISQESQLLLDSTSHPQLVSTLEVSPEVMLSIASTLHQQSVEEFGVVVSGSLAISGTLHTHLVESVSLSQSNVLEVNSAGHTHITELVDLIQSSTLDLSSATHGHSVDSMLITSGMFVSLDSLLHAHSVDDLEITQAHIVGIADATHAQDVGSISLSLALTASIDSSNHTQTVEDLGLSASEFANLQNTVINHTAEEVDLTHSHIIVIDGTVSQQIVDRFRLIGGVFKSVRLVLINQIQRIVLIK